MFKAYEALFHLVCRVGQLLGQCFEYVCKKTSYGIIHEKCYFKGVQHDVLCHSGTIFNGWANSGLL